MTQTQVTAALAEFVVGHPGAAIPERALDEVPRALLDLAGVTIIGFGEPTGQKILRYVASQGARGPSTVFGPGNRLVPTMAALANGTAGHAFDFDDIGVRAGHVSVATMPAAIAVAESVGSSGRAFAEAMVIGYEVASRLTLLYDDSIDGPYAHGFHKPSVYAVFGGTAAACRLLGLDARQVRNALGIAASQTGGLRVNFGTMTKPMHAGIACRTAVEAALLAQDGFTASEEAIEGRFGWYQAICRNEGDLARVVAGLGSTFAVEEGMRYKLYPSCGANHSAIEAMLEVMASNTLTITDVASVDVAVDPRNLEDVLVYAWPRTGLEGKFCLAYNVAAAMVDGAVTVHSFLDSQIERLSSVRELIVTTSDARVPRDGARVVVRTTDGRTFTAAPDSPRGNLGRPLTFEDLAEKFSGNVIDVLGPDATLQAIDGIAGLLAADSLDEVTQHLIARSGASAG